MNNKNIMHFLNHFTFHSDDGPSPQTSLSTLRSIRPKQHFTVIFTKKFRTKPLVTKDKKCSKRDGQAKELTASNKRNRKLGQKHLWQSFNERDSTSACQLLISINFCTPSLTC